VAQFIRVATRILEDYIPDKASIFVDNIGVNRPRSDYRGKLSFIPGIRQYILEHVQNLDSVLADIKRA